MENNTTYLTNKARYILLTKKGGEVVRRADVLQKIENEFFTEIKDVVNPNVGYVKTMMENFRRDAKLLDGKKVWSWSKDTFQFCRALEETEKVLLLMFESLDTLMKRAKESPLNKEMPQQQRIQNIRKEVQAIKQRLRPFVEEVVEARSRFKCAGGGPSLMMYQRMETE